MDADNLSADPPGPMPAGGYRLVVLGGGPAGTVAAREAAQRGIRVALVLPADESAEPFRPTPLTEQIRHFQARTGQPGPAKPPDEPGIDVFAGQAVFCTAQTMAVGGRELRFRKALVATGTSPAPAAIDGADQSGCLRVETLGRLTEPPGRLAVIGCGPAACAWAQAFRCFGSQVHLISRPRSVLPEEDTDAAGLLQARLEQEDVRLYLGCQELVVETTGNLQAVVIGRDRRREKLLVDRILLCGPRQPNTAGLGLDSAGVAYSDHGIVVGDRLQTTNRRIFAAGGVCGARFATPQAAEATARLAVHNALCWIPRSLSRLVIPHCVHTSPMVARVGVMPRDLDGDQLEVDSYRLELAEADEVITAHRCEGFIVVHVNRRTGQIVGATAAAEAADELIAPLVLLMTRRWSLAALADVIACRPSRFELLTRLGERYRQSRRSRFGAGFMERWRLRPTAKRRETGPDRVVS